MHSSSWALFFGGRKSLKDCMAVDFHFAQEGAEDQKVWYRNEIWTQYSNLNAPCPDPAGALQQVTSPACGFWFQGRWKPSGSKAGRENLTAPLAGSQLPFLSLVEVLAAAQHLSWESCLQEPGFEAVSHGSLPAFLQASKHLSWEWYLRHRSRNWNRWCSSLSWNLNL